MASIPQNVLLKALSHYGEAEIGNTNTGPQVNVYLAYVGLAPGQPWCAAAASYWLGMTMEQAGLPTPFKSGSSSAWYAWGKAHNRLCVPQSGAVAVEKGGDTGHCHTLLVLAAYGSKVATISGNDANRVGIEERDASTLDYIWPY